MRKVGLPPVNSNKGVPNGLTSPRRQMEGRSPDRQTGAKQTQSQQGTRNSIKQGSHSVTYRSTDIRNGTERNSDSGVFSDDDSEHRRMMEKINRGGASSLPPTRTRNGGIASEPNTQRSSINFGFF